MRVCSCVMEWFIKGCCGIVEEIFVEDEEVRFLIGCLRGYKIVSIILRIGMKNIVV